MFHCLKFLRLLRIGIHVKKSFEPDQQRPEAMALRPLDGFATAISTALFWAGADASDHAPGTWIPGPH